MGLRSIVFQSLPTEQSGPVGRFTWERGFSSRNRKGQLWECLLSRISRVSKCLTWDTERWDVLSTYELYASFQIFYWLDASDLGGQGCDGKLSWRFHSRDDTYLWLFWWVSAVTGISLKTRVKIIFPMQKLLYSGWPTHYIHMSIWCVMDFFGLDLLGRAVWSDIHIVLKLVNPI
jgi:hypothetical protein